LTPAGVSSKQSPLWIKGKKIIQEWAYNQLGFLLTNTIRNVELGAKTQDLVTTFVPDELNRVKETFFPAGDHHTLSYDHLGRVTSYVVEGVYGETYAYDGNGNLTNRFNGVGKQSFGYDGHDRLVRTTLPNGTAIQQQLDGNGNILARSATDAQGQLLYYSTNSFDAQNRPVVSALQGDAGMALSANTYDSINHRLIVRDALGATLTNWFDSSGRLAGSSRSHGDGDQRVRWGEQSPLSNDHPGERKFPRGISV
jgi:YD repeat-containing protein